VCERERKSRRKKLMREMRKSFKNTLIVKS